MKIDTKLIPYDMPAVHCLILALLADAPEQTMSRHELSAALIANPFHVWVMMGPLREQEMVRESHVNDEYGSPHISLTNAGQVFLDRVEVR